MDQSNICWNIPVNIFIYLFIYMEYSSDKLGFFVQQIIHIMNTDTKKAVFSQSRVPNKWII